MYLDSVAEHYLMLLLYYNIGLSSRCRLVRAKEVKKESMRQTTTKKIKLLFFMKDIITPRGNCHIQVIRDIEYYYVSLS